MPDKRYGSSSAVDTPLTSEGVIPSAGPLKQWNVRLTGRFRERGTGPSLLTPMKSRLSAVLDWVELWSVGSSSRTRHGHFAAGASARTRCWAACRSHTHSPAISVPEASTRCPATDPPPRESRYRRIAASYWTADKPITAQDVAAAEMN